MHALIAVAAGLAVIDFAAWVQRMRRRKTYFALATAAARSRGKPLLIVGRPKGWSTSEGASIMRHGCGDAAAGDVVVDLTPSPECARNGVVADVRDLSRWSTGYFGAVFASCVLEHVDDLRTAWRELKRVSAGPIFVVFPQHWSIFAVSCGAHKWRIFSIEGGCIRAQPIAGRGAVIVGAAVPP